MIEPSLDDPNPPLPPRVILSDQAKGVISSVPRHFPGAILQICSWHAHQAMIKHFRNHGYSKVEVDGGVNDQNEKVVGLSNLTWTYLLSETESDLEVNRQHLINTLRPSE